MAKGRMIPTSLLVTPAFVDLYAEHGPLGTHVLIGMCLDADDYGRGYAHPRTLATKLQVVIEQLLPVLEYLEQKKFIQRYTDDETEQTYYILCRWREWQYGLNKPTPSQFPAPPGFEIAKEPLAKFSRHKSEDEDEDESELEESITPKDTITDDGKRRRSKKVISINNTSTPSNNLTDETIVHLTDQLASALRIPVDPDLMELVRCFGHDPELLLQAHFARTYVDNPDREKNKPGMSSRYFASWYKGTWSSEGYKQSKASFSSGITQTWRSSYDDPNYKDDTFYPTEQERKERNRGENW